MLVSETGVGMLLECLHSKRNNIITQDAALQYNVINILSHPYVPSDRLFYIEITHLQQEKIGQS